jgi:hypothetical protein
MYIKLDNNGLVCYSRITSVLYLYVCMYDAKERTFQNIVVQMWYGQNQSWEIHPVQYDVLVQCTE